MTPIKRSLAAFILALGISPTAAFADPPAPPAQAPAPLGVFGADMPGAGKLVFSILPSFTRMQGSQIGTQSVSAPYIVTNVISAYTPVGTHLLRLVPKHLDVSSEGLAVAYGLNDDVTLFASAAVVQKSVDMQAFKGLTGTTSLGFSTGRTEGFGDSTAGVIVRLHHDRTNRVNLNLGLSLPTGATTDDITLLLPNGTAPAKRGFYAMQPGSGTVDLLPGIAYSGVRQAWSWGLSYRGRLPLEVNSQGWRYGDLQEVNAWAGYMLAPGIEATFRVNASTQGRINGEDPLIRGYAQGADPLFYGGQQVSLYGGLIVAGRYFGVKSMQLGLEAGAPVYQNLNGPQLGRDWQLNLALRFKH